MPKPRPPEYNIWQSMRQRCLNPNNESYFSYGGRGIKICPQWARSFETFFRDVGPRPNAKFSLDRKDNNRNYEPGNCRWATRREQNLNRRPYAETANAIQPEHRYKTRRFEDFARKLAEQEKEAKAREEKILNEITGQSAKPTEGQSS